LGCRRAESSERFQSSPVIVLKSGSPDRVREVRGLGLLIGVELREKVTPYLAALEERGFLAISAGATVLRLLPPLVISDEDWSAGLEAIAEVVGHGAR